MNQNIFFISIAIGFLFFFFYKKQESFRIDPYKQYQIDNKLSDQTYLNFLQKVYDQFKIVTKKNCSPKLTDEMKNEILNPVYNAKNKNDCVNISQQLCEFTDPNFYISSDKSYLPPPWLIKSFKNIEYPKQTNLHCFNENMNCCSVTF